MITSYLGDIAVGDTSVSRQRTITETDIVSFAMFTGDWHPIHTVVPYAEADPRFGRRIAHGALVLSVALGLVEFWPPAMLAFYGFDRLRFVHPTHIGDTLRVETEVLDIRERDDRTGVVTYRFVVCNDKDEQLCVADLLALVAARPGEGGGG
ncbi:MaoC/PaaZ C-terminal domain-containing protein [Labedaea rhizosphaerae]|uniref:Acyl dehydratase n=1 Tax=Labedaea rhizosphaerae TaxID=598644 RepID=A0A4R6SG06_LABRH|nr:MaoC/PaaZ C-terminal domain-containing protein [Labedaea rhizosphaerae]TDP98135.1 acyl dehydratase [Labedaea rhizosphaerae]